MYNVISSTMTRYLIVCLVPLLGVMSSATSFGLGLVDYNDDCEFEVTDYSTFQSRFDESKLCDTTRGLYCVPGLGKCGCYVPHTIYRAGKCRAKIGNSCLAPENVRLDCVEHARCVNNNTAISTFKCQCIKGYLSNAMKTACFEQRVGYGSGYGYYGRRRDGYGDWPNAASDLHALPLSILILISAVFARCLMSAKG